MVRVPTSVSGSSTVTTNGRTVTSGLAKGIVGRVCIPGGVVGVMVGWLEEGSRGEVGYLRVLGDLLRVGICERFSLGGECHEVPRGVMASFWGKMGLRWGLGRGKMGVSEERWEGSTSDESVIYIVFEGEVKRVRCSAGWGGYEIGKRLWANERVLWVWSR